MKPVTRRPKERKSEILDSALILARAVGYQHVTRDDLADRAGCSPGLINVYFGTMPKLRRAIMSAAVARRDIKVLAQGLAAGDAKARAASAELKREAVEGML